MKPYEVYSGLCCKHSEVKFFGMRKYDGETRGVLVDWILDKVRAFSWRKEGVLGSW